MGKIKVNASAFRSQVGGLKALSTHTLDDIKPLALGYTELSVATKIESVLKQVNKSADTYYNALCRDLKVLENAVDIYVKVEKETQQSVQKIEIDASALRFSGSEENRTTVDAAAPTQSATFAQRHTPTTGTFPQSHVSNDFPQSHTSVASNAEPLINIHK